MKYLHDDNLSELTTVLTDFSLGGRGAVSQRVLHGRIEAYTMKRGSGDKKYAFKLGEKYVASLEQHLAEAENANVQQQLQQQQQTTRRKRSQSADLPADLLLFREAADGSALATSSLDEEQRVAKLGRRSRASSFDATRSQLRAANLSNQRNLSPLTGSLARYRSAPVVPSALGDFAAQGTRRLMTDLILTLNMSFPDYDFSAVKPTDFSKVPVNMAVSRITKLLSDVELRKECFLTDLWSSLDAVIRLSECDIYSYQPGRSDPDGDQDDDPMAFLTETLLTRGTEDGAEASGSDIAAASQAGGGVVGGAAGSGDHHVASDDSVGSAAGSGNTTTIWTFNYFFVNKTAKRIVLFTCVESMRNHEPDMRDEDDLDNDEMYSFVPPSSAADSTDLDFDLDPAAAPAGGIPVSSV